ncbi:MAG: hypothetical protein QG622_782 [Actinomycetota bacterium]|nr:hypothetical protein [Actinomycetota bacterium]
MVNGEPVTVTTRVRGGEPLLGQMFSLGPGDPHRVGVYPLAGLLATGRKGRTYLADTPSGPVVLKLLDRHWVGGRSGAYALTMALTAARRLRVDDAVAPLLDTELGTGEPYVVSEFVPGPSVRELVEARGALTAETVSELAVATVRALAAIHAVGLAHGDVHPNTVILGPDGPRTVDVGLFPVRPERPGACAGSSDGLPARDSSTTRAAQQADLTAWAAMLAYAAAGRASLLDLAGRSGAQSENPRARDVLEALPKPLPRIVYACLVPAPSRRPTACQVLEQLAPGLVTSRPRTGGLSFRAPSAPCASAARDGGTSSDRAASRDGDRSGRDLVRGDLVAGGAAAGGPGLAERRGPASPERYLPPPRPPRPVLPAQLRSDHDDVPASGEPEPTATATAVKGGTAASRSLVDLARWARRARRVLRRSLTPGGRARR